MSVTVFPNLSVMAFDSGGYQVPELQKSLLELWAENAVKESHDPEGWIIETPSGAWKLFRTQDGGWNREQFIPH